VNTHACCEGVSTGSDRVTDGERIAIGGPRPATVARRCLAVTGWIVPGGILALLPKCPACLAVYLAIGTGVGISMSAATYLRLLLIVLCVAALSYVLAKQTRHIFERAGPTRGEGSFLFRRNRFLGRNNFRLISRRYRRPDYRR
jgi:hypothetical protein